MLLRLGFIIFNLAMADFAFAQEDGEGSSRAPVTVALQSRDYLLNHDFTVQMGALPADAFNKGYTAGFSYTHYYSDYLAWEIVNFNYSLNVETDLKSDINEQNLDVDNKGFDKVLDFISFYAISSFVYTPLYNKSLLFDRTIILGETSFVAGIGVANFDSTGPRLLMAFGLYLRFVTSRKTSWKFDARDIIYFEETLGVVNGFSIGVGYSWQIGDEPIQSAPVENNKIKDQQGSI